MEPLEVLAIAGVRLPRPCEIVRDENGCAIWPFGKYRGGYGEFYPRPNAQSDHVAPVSVHRTVYAAFHGPIPEGWHVDHVWDRGCRSPACFWPEHLEAVTPAENNRRMGIALRQRRERPCGHSWEDTRPGRSDCAICHYERERARARARPSLRRERGMLMRQLLAAGLNDDEIAAQVGVSARAVNDLRKGKTYNKVY